MKIIAASIAALLLCGCTTTPTELRQREVVGTFKTTKPADAVAGCLAEAFSKVGPPTILDRDGSKVVEFHSANIYYSGSTVLMFTIAPDGSVSVQRANHLIRYKDKVASCI